MKVKNCPFCKARPYMPTKIKKHKWVISCANSRCEIFAIPIDLKKWEEASN